MAKAVLPVPRTFSNAPAGARLRLTPGRNQLSGCHPCAWQGAVCAGAGAELPAPHADDPVTLKPPSPAAFWASVPTCGKYKPKNVLILGLPSADGIIRAGG